MHYEKEFLWNDGSKAFIEKYFLDNSIEYRYNEKRAVVVICPGGGYISTSDREAEPVALKFLAKGIHAIILRYTTYYDQLPENIAQKPVGNPKSAYPNPLFDLARTLQLIHEKADDWFIDTNKIILCGFSAGAHLVASLGTEWDGDLLKKKLNCDSKILKPSGLILGYGAYDFSLFSEASRQTEDLRVKIFVDLINRATFGTESPSLSQYDAISPLRKITDKTPPCFLWHTANDTVANVDNSLRFAKELSKSGVPFELHIFQSGQHGLSTSDQTLSLNKQDYEESVSIWLELCFVWLDKLL